AEIGRSGALEREFARATEDLERIGAERTRLLASEQTARADAEHAGRMRDEFLAVVSHELRTPLNAILGWAQMASVMKEDDSVMKRAVEVIRRNAEIQLRVINELLEVSHAVTGRMIVKPRRLDLVDLLEHTLRTVRPAAAAKSIALRLRLDPAARHVVGERDR